MEHGTHTSKTTSHEAESPSCTAGEKELRRPELPTLELLFERSPLRGELRPPKELGIPYPSAPEPPSAMRQTLKS